MAPVAHVPAEMLKERVARITVPTRNVMQSGSAKLDRWVVTWDTEERWENPLMGWISSCVTAAGRRAGAGPRTESSARHVEPVGSGGSGF